MTSGCRAVLQLGSTSEHCMCTQHHVESATALQCARLFLRQPMQAEPGWPLVPLARHNSCFTAARKPCPQPARLAPQADTASLIALADLRSLLPACMRTQPWLLGTNILLRADPLTPCWSQGLHAFPAASPPRSRETTCFGHTTLSHEPCSRHCKAAAAAASCKQFELLGCALSHGLQQKAQRSTQ